MATQNFNKIIRGNLNLKPLISSTKNPTGIVSSYVQRLYDQLPDNLKSGLMKSRLTPYEMIPRPPPRAAKAPVERVTFPIVNKQKSKGHMTNYRSPPMSSKNSYVKAPKKLLKLPNFKIYNTRRFISGSSTSTASVLRNNHYQSQHKVYKPAKDIQFRTFTGAAVPGASFYTSPGVAKYIAPTRVYNEQGIQERSLEITNAICKDLMSVNKMLKQKIRVTKPKVSPTTVPVVLGREVAMRGWNHPNASNLKAFTTDQPGANKTRPSEKAQPAPFLPSKVKQTKVQSQDQTKSGKETSVYNKRENSRHQIPNVTGYPSVAPASKGAKNLAKERNLPKPVKPTYDWDPLDFVCRSRTDRVLRNSKKKPNREGYQSLQRC